jgi:NAD(P)-dependent dehydrogenase (short-subunit alcohol dehydrogenase family)
VPAALVTGASRRAGIAAAAARVLARDGWDVPTTCWRPYDESEPWGSQPEEAEELVEELRALGVRAAVYEDDLADPAAPARILDAAEAAVGPLTALVNVHAHSETGGLVQVAAEQIDRHLAVNIRGTLLLSAEFVRRFRGEPGSGRIVSFGSGLPLKRRDRLRRQQGRDRVDYGVGRRRARPTRDHRQRNRPGADRHGLALGRARRSGRSGDPARTPRQAGGRRRAGRLPLLGARRMDHRAAPPLGRWLRVGANAAAWSRAALTPNPTSERASIRAPRRRAPARQARSRPSARRPPRRSRRRPGSPVGAARGRQCSRAP